MLRESFQSPISPVLVASMVVVVFLSVFVWAWAVRRPTPVQNHQMERLPITYAAIGASDVEGVGASDPAGENWASLLHSRMPQGTRFMRLGRGGITLHEANALEVPQAVASKPDIVTIWNCVNDALGGVSLDRYTQDLNTALTRLTRETRAYVFLLNLPDISLIMQANAEQRALARGGVQQWNQAIDATAASYKDRVTVVDLYPASAEVLDHPEYLSPDNFHPSTAGYKRLADIVWEAIERERALER